MTLAPARAQQPQDEAKLRIESVRLGFNQVFKVGCWTQMEVTLAGGDTPYTGLITVSTPDADGVPTRVVSAPSRPVGVQAGATTTARLFVRVGQDNANLRVRFIDETGKERASRTFRAANDSVEGTFRMGLPATNRVVAMFGVSQGIGELVRSDEQSNAFNATHAVRVDDPADLPLEWFGYESVDTVIMGGARPESYRPLASNPQRLEALTRWVKSGGRLVIFVGAEAPELIGPGGPLAGLVPGTFDKLMTLDDPQRLQEFSGSQAALTRGEAFAMQVPRLADVRGQVVAFAGDDPTALPLVVRAREGLGEVTFVAVDPDVAPISSWPGRTGLLRQALGWPAAPAAIDETGVYATNGEDLVNKLRRALDLQFQDVKTAPFGIVALLVIVYILLIGPGDYFFVKRVLKRMEATWITFPIIVVTVSIAAYWLAYWMKGDQLRVNQVEIVDVDVAANEARGTVWTHFFNPRVDSYDLKLEPHFADKPLSESSEPGRPDPGAPLVAWLGLPGYGLGGMQGQGGQLPFFESGYAFSPALDRLEGLPVQEWSTKTLTARWSGRVEAPMEARLERLADDQLAGTVVNRSGAVLEDCVLMHGNWAYPLPKLADGASATIDDSLAPRTVKTMLTSLEAGEDLGVSTADDGTALFDGASTDVSRWVKAMMFFEAIGGDEYAGATTNRYQSFIDMSRLLDGDQAILLARAAGANGSQWVHSGGSLSSNQDRRWVYYRFVIALEKSE